MSNLSNNLLLLLQLLTLYLNLADGWTLHPTFRAWHQKDCVSKSAGLYSKRAASPLAVAGSKEVEDFLALARSYGPIGVMRSEEDQKRVLTKAKDLASLSDPDPARIPLRGIHDLVYSAAPGGSSGRLWGPIYGKVTQEFVDEKTFINAVEIGPLKIALTATREVCEDGQSINVRFQKTAATLFGSLSLFEKEVTNGGTWNFIYAGTVECSDGSRRFVRIMETPSLFVLEQVV